MSPRVKAKRRVDRAVDRGLTRAARLLLEDDVAAERERLAADSSQAEFRSAAARNSRPRAFTPDDVFWKYLVTPAVPSPMGGFDHGLDREEHRVLSKASSAAGGYLVPAYVDELITAARRARAVIGNLARELVTGTGQQLLVPSTTTHGVATWTAENVAYTASDEVFGQVTVGAFKSATQVVVSEELARDADADFEAYLADELGQRIAVLEETAYAVGDGVPMTS